MMESFKQFLNPDVKGGLESLFDANGLLSTAADRIHLLELLYWARDDTCHDLRLMKSIRNRFAHHAELDGLKDKKISSWVANFKWQLEKPVLQLAHDKNPDAVPHLEVRDVFLIRSISLIAILTEELAIGPIARTAQISPKELWGTSDNMKPIRRLTATMIHKICRF